jgi:hypothetical protein
MAKNSVKTALRALRMPGFTAEASLPKSLEPYRMLGTLNPSATQGEVVPQICDGARWMCVEIHGEQYCGIFCPRL